MFGIESGNCALNEQTGLTNEAINMLTIAHETNKYPDAVNGAYIKIYMSSSSRSSKSVV